MKVLCCGVLMFELPEDFEGKISDAFRLMADYIDETEGKQQIKDPVNLERPYNEIIDEITNEFIMDDEHKLRIIGGHISKKYTR